MPALPQPLLFKDAFPFPITLHPSNPPITSAVRPIRHLSSRYSYPKSFSCRITFSIERNGETFTEANSGYYIPGTGVIIDLTRQNPRYGLSGDLLLETDLYHQNMTIPFNDGSPEQAVHESNRCPHYTGTFSMDETTSIGVGSLGNPYGSGDVFEFTVNFYDFAQGYFPPYPEGDVEQVYVGPSLTHYENARGSVQFAVWVEGSLGTIDVDADPFYAFTSDIVVTDLSVDALSGGDEGGSRIVFRPPSLNGNAPNQVQGSEDRYIQTFGLNRLLNGNLSGLTSTCPSLTLELVETGRLQYANPTPTAPAIPSFDWGTLE